MKLSAEIQAIHRESRGTYGVPRVHAELADRAVHVGRKRVARLMRGVGLQGVSRRKAFRTTVRDEVAPPASDLVERPFTAAGPDQLWVADIRYVPTWAGFLYLAVVVDAWSRRVISGAMETHLRTELVLAALNMAVAQRRPTAGFIIPTRAAQYMSVAFGQRGAEAGVRPSMGRLADAYDNALGESFFATLECELLDRHCFRTQVEARSRSSSSSKVGTTRGAAIPRSIILSPLIFERSKERDDRTMTSGATIDQGGAMSLFPSGAVQ